MYIDANWLSLVSTLIVGDSASGGSSLRTWSIFELICASAAFVS